MELVVGNFLLTRLCYVNGVGGLPTTEIRFRERLFAVNLVRLMVASIPMTLEADMRLAYGKEIRKEWPGFFQNAVFSLGDGRRINFWKDVWCGEEALCSS